MGITTPRLKEDVHRSGKTRATTGFRGVIALHAEIRWLQSVKYPCLVNDDAQGLLNLTVPKLEASGTRVSAT